MKKYKDVISKALDFKNVSAEMLNGVDFEKAIDIVLKLEHVDAMERVATEIAKTQSVLVNIARVLGFRNQNFDNELTLLQELESLNEVMSKAFAENKDGKNVFEAIAMALGFRGYGWESDESISSVLSEIAMQINAISEKLD
jgi:hypothetical protein